MRLVRASVLEIGLVNTLGHAEEVHKNPNHRIQARLRPTKSQNGAKLGFEIGCRADWIQNNKLNRQVGFCAVSL